MRRKEFLHGVAALGLVYPLHELETARIPEARAVKSQVETVRPEFLKLIKSALETNDPVEETHILLSCKNIAEVREITPYLSTQDARMEAMSLSWKNRLENDKTILSSEVQELCNQLVAWRWGSLQNASKIVEAGIHYELMTRIIEATETFPEEQRISPIFILGIALKETAGGIDYGEPILPWFYNQQYREYFAGIKWVDGVEFDWEKFILARPCSSGGALGLAQVVPNTFGNMGKKADGSNFNVFDFFEGTQAITNILLEKGWDNQSYRACYNAFWSYCAGAYAGSFDFLWNKAKEFQQIKTPFVPNPNFNTGDPGGNPRLQRAA